ncbi:MAG TPA: AraC family transcriptional regulator [Castellaniella sp.]|uniref:AraC family transcriptional regulator n=1 Tax=Castellaniella sp. TaxID=1955812 RepID=UPI002F0B7830
MPMQSHAEYLRSQALAVMRAELSEVIDQRTIGQERYVTAIKSLTLSRRESVTEPCACVVEPSLVVVVQGAKQLLVGDHAYAYDIDHFMITSLDIPASSQVLQASPDKPLLGLVLKLDVGLIAELISQARLPSPGKCTAEASVGLGTISLALLEPCFRLLALLNTPADIPVLAPLIEREIHYKLLKSDLAARLWQIAAMGGQRQRIARAIDLLKANYAEPLHMADLAAHVQMSTSSLHHYFRQLTAKSPLQYQKWLRLREARRLMLNEGMDAAGAAFRVGYESPSQFSREYGRLFGAPPKRDIESLRQTGEVGTVA